MALYFLRYGVGFKAVFKLGSTVKITTKREGYPQFSVKLRWVHCEKIYS